MPGCGPASLCPTGAGRVGPLTLTSRAVDGQLALTSWAVEHGIPAFALRVYAGGRSLVYSGDTAPCAALTELAADCDLLWCEAEGDDPAHHTAEQAGETTAAARAGRLVVVHVDRALAPGAALARAATRFAGSVGHAGPGAVLTA